MPSTKQSVGGVRSSGNGAAGRSRKKTAAAIHQEVAREVNQLLHLVFAQRRQDGRTDLEGVETTLRAALHQAGAAALTQLPQFEAPASDHRRWPCRCGHRASCQEVRSKPVQSVVGLSKSLVLTIGAPLVTPANFPSMSNWTSRTPPCLPGHVACWRWWARMRPSIMAANR